jgi:hypothetical protein
MMPLRQRMIEDMQIRNLSRHIQRAYCRFVSLSPATGVARKMQAERLAQQAAEAQRERDRPRAMAEQMVERAAEKAVEDGERDQDRGR